jgi:hypothetical protein
LACLARVEVNLYLIGVIVDNMIQQMLYEWEKKQTE